VPALLQLAQEVHSIHVHGRPLQIRRQITHSDPTLSPWPRAWPSPSPWPSPSVASWVCVSFLSIHKPNMFLYRSAFRRRASASPCISICARRCTGSGMWCGVGILVLQQYVTVYVVAFVQLRIAM
jgi:hypothetical protein